MRKWLHLSFPVSAALLAALSAAPGCTPNPSATPRPERSRPAFSTLIDRGIDFELATGATGERYFPETMLGGLGWIDYDGDGDYDLYLPNGHSDSATADREGKEANRLYRNDGRGRFADVTEEAGVGDRRYSSGLAVGDFDNDGDSDLFVTNLGRDTLYRNEGDGRFTDVSDAFGITARGYSTSAAWFDMDRDGDLDLFVVRYVKYSPKYSRRCEEKGQTVYCHPVLFQGERDLLYRNLGGGRFEEIGETAGIAKAGPTEGKGLGVVTFDFDRDGDQDVYVTNDTTPNFLWRNRGDGTFEEVGSQSGSALSHSGKPEAGMGVDVVDVDADGHCDLIVTNFAKETNALYLGSANGTFTERSRALGLGASFAALGFGALFVDAELDGDPDLIVVNGHVNDIVEQTDPGEGQTYRQRPRLYVQGEDGTFADHSNSIGAAFGESFAGRGLAGCDLDNDGDTDLAAMTLDRSLVLIRNDTPAEARRFVLKLQGTKSNRDGYGARVVVAVGGRSRAFEYHSARSYLSACDPRLIVGLGGAEKADRVTIHWPSGSVQTLENVEASRSVRLVVEPR